MRQQVSHYFDRDLRRRIFARSLHVEQLESRLLMNVDWRNPVDNLDVNSDLAISPLDVLVVINDLNSRGTRGLPPTRNPAEPFLDPTGNQSVDPLDVLTIINYLNVEGSGSRTLNEQGQYSAQQEISITLGQTSGVRLYRMEVNANFGAAIGTGLVPDLFSVYLVDPANPSRTLLDRGVNGTSLFSLSPRGSEMGLGLARWDGHILEIDLSSIKNQDTGLLRVQLLNGDPSSQATVSIRPLENAIDSDRIAGTLFSNSVTVQVPGPALNLATLTSASTVKAEVENVWFDSALATFVAEVGIRNLGSALGRDVALVLPGLPSGVTLSNASGTSTSGVPYLNLREAIKAGGLGMNSQSDRVELRINNPGRQLFTLQPQILVGVPNRAPVLAAIPTQIVMPGGHLEIKLAATDPDADRVTYTARETTGNSHLPKGNLQAGTGSLVFAPMLNDLGTYQIEVTASDGALTTLQNFTLNVVADPITTTRISGFILDVNKTPLAGMKVEIGAVQGLTQSNGSFSLDLGSGVVVSDTLKVRGETFPGSLNYPFIGEKLPLLLEHSVYLGVNNVVSRPIFLPPLDVANGKLINPMQDTTVTTAALSGASVFVKAGTLMNQQGTPFTGVLSITEVPVSLTPAALPEGLIPDLVVTIQPGEMVFAQPAPLSLPNRVGYLPGTLLNLWSINPVTGDFDKVGVGKVRPDGSVIDTISGGVRNSSWHLFNSEPAKPNRQVLNASAKPPAAQFRALCTFNCDVDFQTGGIIETHDLVSYQSLGVERSLKLTFTSLRADARPIIHFGYDSIIGGGQSDLYALAGIQVAGAGSQLGEGFTNQVAGMELAGLNLPPGSNVFSIAADASGNLGAALQLDMRNEPSGVFDYALSQGLFQYNGTFLGGSATTTNDGKLISVNTKDSPLGSGWGIAGLKNLVANADGSILLIDGDGSELVFGAPTGSNGIYVPSPGDFSTFVRGQDGKFRHTQTDQTVFRFSAVVNGQSPLENVTDRDGVSTQYAYDSSGRLATITDPVGLQTTFDYSQPLANDDAGTANVKPVRITDPAGRVTTLSLSGQGTKVRRPDNTLYTIPIAGVLIRITDPDGTSRTFEYDTHRLMTAEIDKNGNREEAIFDEFGRGKEAHLKDGTVLKIQPAQVRGLYSPERTLSLNNAPPLVSLDRAEATYVDPNGDASRSQLDQNGQAITQTDSISQLPAARHDESNLVTRTIDARGNSQVFQYDERGNLILATRPLSTSSDHIFGAISNPGDKDIYTFTGTVGQRLYFDSLYKPGDPFFNISLTGPDGGPVDLPDPVNHPNGYYTLADLPLILLPQTGTYRLTIHAIKFGSVVLPDATGPYEFRLIDMDDGTELKLAELTTARLTNGLEASVFRYQGRAGERLRFQPSPDNTDTSNSRGRWTLFGPGQGEPIPAFGQGPFIARANLLDEFTVLLPANGLYALVVESFKKETYDFKFQITDVSDAPVTPSGFGVRHAGTIAPSQQQTFTFTANAGRAIYVDSLVANKLFASITTPMLETTTNFSQGFAFESLFKYVLPQTGTYTVKLQNFDTANSHDFDFRILDIVNAAVPLTLGTLVSDTNAPLLQAGIYRFDGSAGQRLSLADSAFAPNGERYTNFSLIAPSGLDNFQSNGGPFTLMETGTYYLLANIPTGGLIDTPAPSRFRLSDVALTPVLKFNATTSGTLSQQNPQELFQFNGTVGQRIDLELTTNASRGLVSLYGPRNQQWNGLGFPDNGTTTRTFELPFTGTHVFGFAITNASSPVTYSFKVVPAPVPPTPIALGPTPITGRVAAGQKQVFTFTGTAGQRVYFDVQGELLLSAALRAPFDDASSPGFSGFSLDVNPFTLTQSGTYELTLTNSSQTGTKDYKFRILDMASAPMLTDGSTHAGRLDNSVETDVFQITGTTGQRFRFTQTLPVANASSTEWTLLGIGAEGGQFFNFLARGPFASANPETTLEATLPNAGTYYLVLRHSSASTDVDYSFQVQNLPQTATVPSGFGTVHSGTLQALETISFPFDAPAGRVVYFDQTVEGTNNGVSYTLSDPTGVNVTSVASFFGADGIFIVPRSGTNNVTATADGFGPDEFSFRMLDLQASTALTLGTLVTDTFQAADNGLKAYRFAGTAGQRIVFDNLDRNSVNFSIFGPGGYPVNAGNAPTTLSETGTYYLLARLNVGAVFQFRLSDVAAAPLIDLDTIITGTLDPAREIDVFRLDGIAGQRLYFDGLTSSFVTTKSTWLLYGPYDQFVVLLGTGGDFLKGFEVILPVTGPYTLVLQGTVENIPIDSYSFHVVTPETQTVRVALNADQAGTRYTYDATFNQVTSKTDELGRQTIYENDPASGRVLSETRVVGQLDSTANGETDDVVTRTTYTPLGLIDTETDPLGRITDYEYNPLNYLTKVSFAKGTPNQTTQQFEYDAAGNLTVFVDENAHRTEYQYDPLNRLIRTTEPDPDGAGPLPAPVTRFTYDVVGNRITTTSPLGHVNAFQYDTMNRLKRTTQPDPDGTGPQLAPILVNTYDNAGNLVTSTDPRGNTTSYRYDARNRLVDTIDAAGGHERRTYDTDNNLRAVTDPNGHITRFVYDARSRLIQTIDALGHASDNTYDTEDQLVSVTDRNGHTTKYEYDELGRLIRTIEPDPDGAGPLLSPVTAASYDKVGNKTSSTDPLGRVALYSYDALNRLVRKTDPDPDGAGPLASPITIFAYDPAGNLVSTTDPRGGVTLFQYDALDRRIRTTAPDPDGAGPLASPVEQNAYDAEGNRTSVTDQLGRVTQFVYDNLNRLIRTTEPDPDGAGPLAAAVTQLKYDANGNLTAIIDPLLHTTTYVYDKLSRQTTATDARSGVTTVTYDAVGNVLTERDAVGNISTYAYDALDRLTSDTDARGKAQLFQYDAEGSQTRTTDRNGRVRQFEYDALDRLTGEKWLNGNAAVVQAFAWTYDAAGQMLRASDADSSDALTYDRLGRMTSIVANSDLGTATIDYSFDVGGNILTVRDMVNGVVGATDVYTHDALNRLTQTVQTGTGVSEKRVNFKYNSLGQFVSIDRFADAAGAQSVASTAYGYDELHRPTSITHTNAAGPVSNFTFAYDVASRLTHLADGDGSADYTYDNTDQLVGADFIGPLPDESYGYDLNGNRLTSSLHPAGYTIGAGNRLTSDGKFNYAYDNEGNLTRRTEISTGHIREYEWDYRNRLVAVTDRNSVGGPATMTAEYIYDTFDRRITKSVDANPQDSVDAAITQFVYDRDNVRIEFLDADGSGPQPSTLNSRLLHGPGVDQILAQENSSGDVLWHLADHLGTVHDLVKSTGVVANHILYDSFGNVLSQTNATAASRYLFTGREFDAETGQYYNRARYYDSAIGRFLSTDPIRQTNLYRYASNNPVGRTDPSGQADCSIFNLNECASRIIKGVGKVFEVIVNGVKSLVDAAGNFIQAVGDFITKRINGDNVVRANNGVRVLPAKKPQPRPVAIPPDDEEFNACPSGRILTKGGGGLISEDSSGILAKGGANILTKGGAGILAKGGAGILTKGGAGILTKGGGNILTKGGGSILTKGGGNILTKGGGSILTKGGGNILTKGGGNILTKGGGSILTKGGGNILTKGGGSLVSPGAAGNFRALTVSTRPLIPEAPVSANETSRIDARESLTEASLIPVLAVAVDRWVAAGLPLAAAERLRQLDVEIADLPTAYLGIASENRILIDLDAAGYGWFVDVTPQDDDEFLAGHASPATGRVDLLTVLAHELGHVLGLEHTDAGDDLHDVMAATLQPGVRQVH